ncbi:MAG: biopolymer transporter ExbD [Terrimicrobiaceae bacterium]|nr:biopolymer transporter ExbD [Terrimicrobiaceae bacterium]
MAGGGVSEDGDVGFQIAPMVDVVFVLLLFFMASAGSQVVEKELNINLPSGRSADAGGVPTTPIIIDIFPDGKVQMNNRVYDNPTSKELPELRAWLKDTVDRFGGKDPVIIRPDPNTRHERIMDVLNAASAAGVTKLSFS